MTDPEPKAPAAASRDESPVYAFGPPQGSLGLTPGSDALPQNTPWSVLAALGLQAIDLFLTAISLLGALVADPHPVSMATKILFVAVSSLIYILLMWKISSQRDWARMILLNLTILGIILLAVGSLGTDGGAASIAVLLFYVGLRAASVALLYLPPSNRWFDADQSPN